MSLAKKSIRRRQRTRSKPTYSPFSAGGWSRGCPDMTRIRRTTRRCRRNTDHRTGMSVVPARLRPCWPRTALRGFFGPSTPPPEFPVKSVIKNKPDRLCQVVTGPFRSVQRSGRCRVGELLNGGGDPAPGVGAVVIAVGRKLVGPRDALLERFIAVALQH